MEGLWIKPQKGEPYNYVAGGLNYKEKAGVREATGPRQDGGKHHQRQLQYLAKLFPKMASKGTMEVSGPCDTPPQGIY